ncbi:hypothetical protein [Virgibacillus kimchii]
MKVKTFAAMTENGLDKKVNALLEQDIEIIEVKFSMSLFGYGAMVIYKERR